MVTPTGPARSPAGAFAVFLPLLAVAIFLPVALIVRRHGFDGLYGQDAYYYQAFATGTLREALLRGQLLAPDFTWPTGYPYLAGAASMALGTGTLAGQAVSLLAAASVPVTTALLALELTRGASGQARGRARSRSCRGCWWRSPRTCGSRARS
jgi:hypothetical protein